MRRCNFKQLTRAAKDRTHMGATEESVRRSARMLTGFMTPAEAQGIANGQTLDAAAFMAAWQGQQGNAAQTPQGYVAPKIEDLSSAAANHANIIRMHPAFVQVYGANAEFKMVELGALIAMQLWLDTDASDGVHGGGATSAAPPTENQILERCLPQTIVSAAQTLWTQEGPNLSILSMNNTFGIQGIRTNPATGEILIVTGTNPNLMVVREHAGRYVLANGYHRAWSLLKCGVAMVPVVITPVKDATELTHQPGFFQAPLLLSARPPLLRDFLDNTLSVSADIRSTMRVVRIVADVLTIPRLV